MDKDIPMDKEPVGMDNGVANSSLQEGADLDKGVVNSSPHEIADMDNNASINTLLANLTASQKADLLAALIEQQNASVLASLSEQQKSELLVCHLEAVKRIRSSMLRSDWHTAFEAALRIMTDKYGDSIRLLVEEELGIEPPRADFIVLVENERVKLKEAIFAHFKTHNIIEYKNPNDKLNEQVLWKSIGYAGLYIANNGVDANEVTVTHTSQPEKEGMKPGIVKMIIKKV